MADIIVEKVCIKIGKKTLEMSPAELKELRDILDQTFPKPTKEYVGPVVIHEPYIAPHRWYHWEPTWTVTNKLESGQQMGTLCLSSKN